MKNNQRFQMPSQMPNESKNILLQCQAKCQTNQESKKNQIPNLISIPKCSKNFAPSARFGSLIKKIPPRQNANAKSMNPVGKIEMPNAKSKCQTNQSFKKSAPMPNAKCQIFRPAQYFPALCDFGATPIKPHRVEKISFLPPT